MRSLSKTLLAFALLHSVLQGQICLLLQVSLGKGSGIPLQYFCLENPIDGGALHSQQKQDEELTVAQIMNSLLPNSDLN